MIYQSKLIYYLLLIPFFFKLYSEISSVFIPRRVFDTPILSAIFFNVVPGPRNNVSPLISSTIYSAIFLFSSSEDLLMLETSLAPETSMKNHNIKKYELEKCKDPKYSSMNRKYLKDVIYSISHPHLSHHHQL